MLYTIGAIIAVIGVITLISEDWNEISTFGRLSVSLGVTCACYVVAMLLRLPEQKNIAQVLFTIAAVLAPVGAYVCFAEANASFDLLTQSITALVLVVIFGLAFLLNKHTVLILIPTGFASWAYYAATLQVTKSDYGLDVLLELTSIPLGIAYFILATQLQTILNPTQANERTERHVTQGILYGLGTIFILGAVMELEVLWADIILLPLILAVFYASIYFESRSVLLIAALFLITHILI